MTIVFDITDHYALVTYTGQITDVEFFTAWKDFYRGDQWTPGMNELNDLSNADLSEATTKGIRTAADYAKTIHDKHDKSFKVALYAPMALQYGIARVYGAIGVETLGTPKVFQDIQEAMDWLKLHD